MLTTGIMPLFLCSCCMPQIRVYGEGSNTGISADNNNGLVLPDLKQSGRCVHKFNVIDRKDVLQVLWAYIDSFISVELKRASSIREILCELL